jgi:hypothetical protein
VIKPATVETWIYHLGGRRFVMAGGAGWVNMILFACHLLSENGYITLTAMTVGAYLTANTIEGFRGGKGGDGDKGTGK